MDTKTIERIKAHYLDEGDSATIYQVMADITKNKKQKDVFVELKKKELEHQAEFAKLLKKEGLELPVYKASFKIQMMSFLATHGFASSVLKLRIFDESKEIKMYFHEARNTEGVTAKIAKDEAEHALILQEALTGNRQETWHHHESGGMLRTIIYGFNDGLTANFGLVMGVIGTQTTHHAILFAGIAGLMADTLSMGSSSFLAASSEKEVNEHELEMEREEIRLMPEKEKEELALIYQSKGLSKETAQRMANEMMKKDPDLLLNELASEELGINANTTSPLNEGLVTAVSTFVGAAIPLIPLFFGSSLPFVLTSFVISMAAHFGVGAVRSLFTGRGVIRSGMDMFVVGLGVAIAGYAIGYLLTGHL